MGNLLSSSHYYDKDTVVRQLWKSLRAIPVFPINPNLEPLRVLNKHSDGYHDVGNVYSLCKPGENKDWLQDVLYPSRLRRFKQKEVYLLPPKSLGQQSYTIKDTEATVARFLVGPANAEAWFTKAGSIEVCISECEERAFNKEHWEEMMRHFDPDMTNSMLGPPGRRHGKRELFIVQKVLLVSHITITASYSNDAGVDIRAPVLPSKGVDVEVGLRSGSSGVVREFTLSASQSNQKLPIAFSGFKYTYDRYGVLEKYAKETRTQPDLAGTSSSHTTQDLDSKDEDADGDRDGDEDTAANDPDMGDFFEEEEDWCTSVISTHDPKDYEIYDRVQEVDTSPPASPPASPPGSPHGSPQRDLEDID